MLIVRRGQNLKQSVTIGTDVRRKVMLPLPSGHICNFELLRNPINVDEEWQHTALTERLVFAREQRGNKCWGKGSGLQNRPKLFLLHITHWENMHNCLRTIAFHVNSRNRNRLDHSYSAWSEVDRDCDRRKLFINYSELICLKWRHRTGVSTLI